jgi:hypothetical protein
LPDTAKDILADMPDRETEEYELPNGRILKIRGISSFEDFISIAETVEQRRALPKAPPEQVLRCIEMFCRGVVEPAFTYSQALEFSRKDGILFGGIVQRIDALSNDAMKKGIADAREEISRDPTSAA